MGKKAEHKRTSERSGVVKSSRSGWLYKSNSDIFSSAKIQRKLRGFMDSDIDEEIKSKKRSKDNNSGKLVTSIA